MTTYQGRPSTSNPATRRPKSAAGDFTWSKLGEPHKIRVNQMKQNHPELYEQIENLIINEGTEPLTFPIVLLILAIQFSMAYYLRNAEWYVLLPCAYIVGGTANHSLQLAVHELSHDLCFSGTWKNRLLAIVANLPTGFPSGQTFRPYHMDHHNYQGSDGIDTDIPCWIETTFVTNMLSKIIWLMCQPLCYALRPMLIKPQPFGYWEGLNWLVQVAFNAAVIYFFGLKAFTYFVAGTLLGLGLHPSAGHFVAEHYEFVSGQETYSYYGPANFFNFNVGYHNEHHDFPKVPWSKLPKVREIAPMYYDNLPCYTSYITEVFWPYITDPDMGVFCRIKRDPTAKMAERLKKDAGKSKFRFFTVVAFVGMIGSVVFLLAMLASAVLPAGMVSSVVSSLFASTPAIQVVNGLPIPQ